MLIMLSIESRPIILIEDQKLYRDCLTKILEPEGFQVPDVSNWTHASQISAIRPGVSLAVIGSLLPDDYLSSEKRRLIMVETCKRTEVPVLVLVEEIYF